eukprot:10438784-Alexandrium_andersonii.AAC.1
MQVDELQVAVDQVSVNRLGEGVRRVLLPRPLQEREVPRPDSLLYQQLGDGKVPDSADSGAPANSDCRAA